MSKDELKRLRALNAVLVVALTDIAERCEDHPVFMPDATDEEMMREGGDAAEITYMAHIARAAITECKS